VLNPEERESKPEPHKEQHLDPNVREAARSLERALGVKVEIQDRRGKGKIILKYSCLEDFDRILEALAK
jgi:ParB family chromosome partitioning protein